MKIGILTFHFVYNYGAMLQAYALMTYLKELGFDVEIIDYRPSKINDKYRPRMINWIRRPVKQLKRYIKLKRSKTNFDKFEKFALQYLLNGKGYKRNEVDDIMNYKDIVFVGSDQIWNFDITGGDFTYFLKNIKINVKKIAYAASCGNYVFGDEYKKRVKDELKKFAAISGREKGLVEQLKTINDDMKIECVPDPVFLINIEKWDKIIKKVNVPKKYILFYSLNRTSALIEYTIQISKKESIPVVAIHPLYRNKEFKINRTDIGPSEFLWLIKNAEFVVTDSFHATAFSIIFNKKIIVDDSKDRGGRIRNIFEELGIEDIHRVNGLSIVKVNKSMRLNEYSEIGKKFIAKYIE